MELLIFIASLVASFIFSLGGVGAAIVLIPILIILGIPVNIAKPVGLFYNTVSLTGASIDNIKNKRLDFKAGIPIIISSFLFAIFGAYISKFIPTKIILILFIGFLLFSSLMFIFYKPKEKAISKKGNKLFIQLTLIGAFAGTLSGMLGIGGGLIISPLMLLVGFDPKKITAITAFVVPFSSFSGFLTYWATGNIDWKITIIASIGGIIGATAGTSFMHKKLSASTVKKILAIILLILAAKLILRVV